MLTQIQIRDYAIVDSLELDLQQGMTVITGETGTGKSILVEALGLTLGDRADSSVIRKGCQRTEISAVFDITGINNARQWLQKQELDDGDECQLRRVISTEGRSKSYINGRPVPLQSLRELGDLLVDIHGQHEHQSLLKKESQRQLLDHYAGHNKLLGQVADAFNHINKLTKDLNDLRQATNIQDDQLALLRYQADELKALNLSLAELQSLEAEQRRLANADKLIDSYRQAIDTLYDEDQSVNAKLATIIYDLQQHQQDDARLEAINDLLLSASIQTNEATSELRLTLDNLDVDPARLGAITQQLDDIYNIARKHRVQAEELPSVYQSLEKKLSSLENVEALVAQINKEIEIAKENYQALAKKLGASRQRFAKKLDKQITTNMQKLGMPGGCIEIKLEPHSDGKYTSTGIESVEYLVSTNPDQTPMPLKKIVSGGELSRISLAIQVISSQNWGTPTLIFDEVDVGIGGRVAEIVGQMLRLLGTTHQTLCVTHLPQVATLGHHHLRVTKEVANKKSLTNILSLSVDQRSEEIARMLGGIEITEQTRAHAQEMMDRAQLLS